jgi:hypothetical protein
LAAAVVEVQGDLAQVMLAIFQAPVLEQAAEAAEAAEAKFAKQNCM